MKKLTSCIFFVSLFLYFSCNSNKGESLNNKLEGINKNEAINAENNLQTDSNSTVVSEKNFNSESRDFRISDEEVSSKKENAILKKENAIVEKIIESPLKKLFKYGEIGKTYTKKELIEQYNFPKESIRFIKNVTYTGHNTLYFNWGSTWFIEKISDAKFQNGPMIFDFKKDKTIIKGGAIGIKYKRKIYTELIIKKDNAYIPSVKGFYWEIKK